MLYKAKVVNDVDFGDEFLPLQIPFVFKMQDVSNFEATFFDEDVKEPKMDDDYVEAVGKRTKIRFRNGETKVICTTFSKFRQDYEQFYNEAQTRLANKR
jgi:hypothetical protein